MKKLLMNKAKTNLDIFWLKDENLAREITDNLESALEQFRSIYEDLEKK